MAQATIIGNGIPVKNIYQFTILHNLAIHNQMC